MNTTVNVIWQEGDYRVIQHANGKFYPQRYYIGVNGPDWQYEREYKGYKTLAGAKKALPKVA